MYHNEDPKCLRTKYGLSGQENIPENSSNTRHERERDFSHERTVLIKALDRISKVFLTQLLEGNVVLENDSKFVEEFCTIIELCIQHGWKDSQKSILRSRNCFWVVLENYSKKVPSKGSNQTAYDIVQNHLTLSNNISKLRAWIRISLTKKILVTEINHSLSVVKKLESCYYKWSVTRTDSFSTFLSVIKSLDRIDFNLLVKESTLNLSEKSLDWLALVNNNKLHLNVFAPYLNLEYGHELDIEGDAQHDKNLIRQVGFLEDENFRLRRSILQQFNSHTKLEFDFDNVRNDLVKAKRYISDLELEIQRLQKEKYELNESGSNLKNNGIFD